MLPSLLKSKDPLSGFFFFWHQLEDTSLSYHFSLCQLPWIPWLRVHIKRSRRSEGCDLLDFFKFPKHLWQHVYPKIHDYLVLSFLDIFFEFFEGLLLHWLILITYIWNELALHVWIAYMNDDRSNVPIESSVLRGLHERYQIADFFRSEDHTVSQL